jgi:NAD(P)-dependent dehydrogenase (short-subunit alcohol dehydrogenase family)
MTFSPRSAIVTGSESGIGRAIAVELAKAGMDVGITWRDDEKSAWDTAAEAELHGVRTELAHIDVAKANAPDVIDDLADRLGGLDVFVNNAGLIDSQPLLEMSDDTWDRTIAVNLTGAFRCIQRAARRMVAAGRGGRLIAVTSINEHQPRIGFAAYSAAKHGLGAVMKTAAIELGIHGITANTVAPGEIATGMTGMEDDDPEARVRHGIPIPRPGDAREIAAAVAFLASPAAGYVNGASWLVDGGILLQGPQGGSHLTNDDWREQG